MDKYEIARKASSLPESFADRIPPHTLEIIELFAASIESQPD